MLIQMIDILKQRILYFYNEDFLFMGSQKLILRQNVLATYKSLLSLRLFPIIIFFLPFSRLSKKPFLPYRKKKQYLPFFSDNTLCC